MKISPFFLLVCLFCAATLGCAQETPTAPADYTELLKEYNAAQREFSEAYGKAKTDEERQRLFREKYPQPEKYAPRFLKFAEQNPEDPRAVDALVWVVQHVHDGEAADQAFKRLRRDHLQSRKIAGVCQTLIYSRDPEAEQFLREILEKNTHHEVKGWAKFSLGKILTNQRRGGQLPKEAEDLFEDVEQNFSDVKGYRGKLADLAKGELFEARNLAIGKVAPDIEGEDVEGEKFKLSDYRGKVVVIDFWGDW